MTSYPLHAIIYKSNLMRGISEQKHEDGAEHTQTEFHEVQYLTLGQ
jgi:hypothetical protein